ncbi:response regulator transcription factor [Microbispora sp. H10830]|uniref:response regulator transcription factor n=1 Tax=Microbispora sp. H10830 TaxID=2729109 RepID=UPI00160306D8|nr:response regulator transcription factor [Microbispora sp. H10830]
MSESDKMISIAVVDDHALFREGLREILEAQDDFEVVGEAGDSDGAVALVERERPDVVLLDVEIPGDDATQTVARMRTISPESQIIILSMYDGPQLLSRLLAAGIRGYLLKSVHRQELISAVRSVRTEPDRLVLAVSRDSFAQVQGGGSKVVLTDREREILELAAQALSNYQIATRLTLTEATIKRHLHNIFTKLGAVSRIDAVNKALAASLISPRRDQPAPRPRPNPPGLRGQRSFP